MARIIEITTPLEKDVLLFHKMRAKEEMSRLFEYQLELLSLKEDIDLDALLGQSITIGLERADGSVRHFNGLCSRISEGEKHGRFFKYHATVRPWLWMLTRTKNYRMFQEKTVPDILKEMFDQHSGIANVDVQLTETYTPWVYCVQYNETDFAFVSRLMEHEGIYYFFKHTEDKHTLVIADSYSAHTKCYEEEISYIPPQERARPEVEHVSEWKISRELQPGKYALASYDFEKPSVDLQVRSSIQRPHAQAEYEVFEYGGDYVERGDGEVYVRTRIEEVQSKYERARGATNARALAPGYLFNLGMHPRADQNAEYLVVSAEYEMQSGEHEGIDTTAAEYRLPVHGSEQSSAISGRADDAEAGGAGSPDGAGRGTVWRRHLHGQVRSREGPFLLGPEEQPRRQELVLDPGVTELGRQGLGRDVHSPRRPGSDRDVRGG